jgi:hypothetical protein
MDCQAFESALADVLESSRLPAEARQHMAQCERCSRLTSELELIAGRARQLAVVEPREDLWPRIRQRLEQEGIIHNRSAKSKVVYSFPVSRGRS